MRKRAPQTKGEDRHHVRYHLDYENVPSHVAFPKTKADNHPDEVNKS